MMSGDNGLAARMQRHAWVETPIGPESAWPPELRTLVGVMLGSKQPMFTVWGPSLTLLYNDAYRSILGHKDHDALGRSFLDVWDEIRSDLAPLVERSFAGEAVHMDDITLIMNREGKQPEAHFAFSYTPVRDRTDAVRGFFCACRETTDFVLAARRQAFRLDLEVTLRGLEDAGQVIETATGALGRHLQARRVCYGERAPDGQLVFQASWNEQAGPPLQIFAAEHYGTVFAGQMRQGRTVAVDGVPISVSLPGQPDLQAYVAVPVRRSGVVEAVLFVGSAMPRRWSPDEITLIESVATRINDAAQRLRAEHDARASEANFRSLMRAMLNQVWTATPAGVIDWVNERAIEYAGSNALAGASPGWASLIHPDDLAAADEHWQAAIISGLSYEGEFRLRRADGAYHWHLVRAVPQRDVSGRIARWIGTNTDIDDQKRAELDLVAAKAAAEEANLAKSTFIANMSHELRTPLSAIIGYSEMMAEEMADGCEPASSPATWQGRGQRPPPARPDQRRARPQQGRERQDGRLRRGLRHRADAARGRDHRGQPGRQEGQPAGAASRADLGSMHSDLTKVRQILLNLLSNAAKFTEAGTITLSRAQPTAAARPRLHGARHRHRHDARAARQAVPALRPGRRLDHAPVRRHGPRAVADKAFADMLGGTVAVESAPGEGSTFTLTRAGYPSPSVGRAPSSSPRAPGRRQPAGSRPCHRRRRGPARADDALPASRGLPRPGRGRRPDRPGSARALRPRAILLDVMMPGIDGWSVLTS